MPFDQDVYHREGKVSQEFPDLSGEQHPQDPVLSIDPDPAPAHRYLWGVVPDFLETHGRGGDNQRNAPTAKHNKEFDDMKKNAKSQLYITDTHWVFIWMVAG